MRVLHVIPGLAPTNGGPAFALVGLVPALVRQGVDARVVTTFREDDPLDMCTQLVEGGAEVRRVGPVSGPLSRCSGISQDLEAEIQAVDIVHIHCIWEEIQHRAAKLAYKHKKPYVIRPCGMLDPWSLRQSKWRKKVMLSLRVRRNLNRAAALHFTARIERDLVTPLAFAAPSIVESNGINTDHLLDPVPTQHRLSNVYPQLEGRPIVLFFSRLHPKKGPDLLLQSFGEVLGSWDTSTHGKKPSLVFVGPDEVATKSKLQNSVQMLGLQNDVVFTGLLSGLDKAGALQSADLFCLPSHQENFGIAVVESLAAGTPVLISDQVNIHEEITAAGVGQAVPLGGDALTNALRSWMTHPQMRESAARIASDWACRTYSWQSIAQHWARDHYPRLLEAELEVA